MKDFIDELVLNPIPWLSSDSDSATIAISSRIRFARNITGFNFPVKLDDEERSNVYELAIHAVKSISSFDKFYHCQMEELDEVSRQVLLERHLVSTEHMAASGLGRGVLLSADEAFSIMVNEDDHIRLQGLRPGLQLQEVYTELVDIDREMDKELRFTYRNDIGYLSSCPTNVGTGMRASVMLHLPGLVYAKQIEQVMNALSKMGMAVRGIFGEGSDALCNLFQISNQSTLGESELQIIDRLSKVVGQVITHEENARQTLLQVNENFIYDLIGRAYGVLKHSYLLDSKEALSKLSALRLGVDMGAFAFLTKAKVNELIVITQPGHLQKYAKRDLFQDERDIYRATLVRNKLAGYDNAED